MTGRVVVFGSLNVDVVVRVPRLPGPGETLTAHHPVQRFAGGKGGNQAVAAAAAGAEVVMVGAVGSDDTGRGYRERLARLGIEAQLRVVDAPTGTAYVWVADSGENSIVVAPGANEYAPDELVALRAADVLLCQLEVPVATVARAVRRATRVGARVIVNAAPYAALPPEVIAVADPLVVNEHEAAQLADSGLLPTSLLVTFGAAGARWDDEQIDGIPVPDDQVLDTTGAGDAFCGVLAARLAAGDSRRDAMRAAAEAGAEAVRRIGAQPDLAL